MCYHDVTVKGHLQLSIRQSICLSVNHFKSLIYQTAWQAKAKYHVKPPWAITRGGGGGGGGGQKFVRMVKDS